MAQFLSACEEGWASGERFEYAIRGHGRDVLGSAGLKRRIAPGGLEVGYWVHQAHTRHGVATQAVQAPVDAEFELGWVTHLEIRHDEANVASGGIPRALGFRLLGMFPSEPVAPAETGNEARWRLDAVHAPQQQ